MKFKLFLFVYFILFTSSDILLSQEKRKNSPPLTLNAAIEQAIANYPSIQIQQTFVEQAIGQKATAGVFPNPILTYYREDLSFANLEIG